MLAGNILAAVLGTVAVAAGIWVWWFENHGPEETENKFEDSIAVDEGTSCTSSTTSSSSNNTIKSKK